MTIGIGFAVRNAGLASAIAITFLNRLESTVSAGVYFPTEVPLLLGVAAVARCRRSPAVPHANLARTPPVMR